MKWVVVLIALFGFPVAAASDVDLAVSNATGMDVVILGEVHDNPDHHLRQADIISRLSPAAVVYEMLTPEQAALVTPEAVKDPETLARLLNWQDSGWPDFDLYAPVFSASPDSAVYGALIGREKARQSMQDGLAATFGAASDIYGLTTPLDPAEQARRQAMQKEAHCNALPDELLASMVDIQRLRDAELARTVIEAFDSQGGPVVLITGNGHARRDWGVPVYLARVRPDLRVFVLGQNEGDSPDTDQFDVVLSAPPAEREDPCAAFNR